MALIRIALGRTKRRTIGHLFSEHIFNPASETKKILASVVTTDCMASQRVTDAL
jgi:hypothetical protein